jgi:hypothetical protein
MDPNSISWLREDDARTERWKHLTEGLSKYQRKVVETLLDNQDRLVKGQLPGAVMEETTTANVQTFSRFTRPMVRRVYPGLIANELVSIQPMPLPDARVFFLDFKYGNDYAPTVKGDKLDYQSAKRNKFFASGMIRGEAVGTGDGVDTTFNLDWYPVKAG